MIDFNALIEKHLKVKFKPKKAGRYYPSEIGSCIRKIWYSYMFPKETDAELMKIPYMLVVVDREIETYSVSDRLRSNEILGILPLPEFRAMVKTTIEAKI